MKISGKLKNIGFNAIAFGYSQLVSLALQFIQIPIFLRFWGKDLYGEWLVITGLANALVLLDVGVTKASESNAISCAAQKNWAQSVISLHTAQAYTLVVIVATCSLSFLAPFIHWTSLLKLHLINQKETGIIIIYMLGIVAISLQHGMTDARFKVSNKTAIGTFLLANRRVLVLVVSSLLLWVNSSPIIVAFGWFASEFILLIILEIICRIVSPVKLHGLKNSSKIEFKKIIKPSVSYLAFPLSQALTLQGGVQLLNQFAGSGQVVSFTLVRTMVRVTLQLGMVVNNSLKPEISRLAGEKRFDEILNIRKNAFLFSLLGGIFIFISIIFIGPFLIKVWSASQIIPTRGMITLISLHAIFNLIWMVPGAIDMALNRHSYLGKIVFTTSLIAFVLWMLVGNHINPIVGASILLAAPEVFAAIALLRKMKNKIHYND